MYVPCAKRIENLMSGRPFAAVCKNDTFYGVIIINMALHVRMEHRMQRVSMVHYTRIAQMWHTISMLRNLTTPSSKHIWLGVGWAQFVRFSIFGGFRTVSRKKHIRAGKTQSGGPSNFRKTFVSTHRMRRRKETTFVAQTGNAEIKLQTKHVKIVWAFFGQSALLCVRIVRYKDTTMLLLLCVCVWGLCVLV